MKNGNLNIRIPQNEKAKLQLQAKSPGATLSGLLRSKLVDDRHYVRVDHELYLTVIRLSKRSGVSIADLLKVAVTLNGVTK